MRIPPIHDRKSSGEAHLAASLTAATDRVGLALHWLAERRFTAVLFLVALNSLTNPYAGIVHDAAVYSLQVLNRTTGGAFQNDLFLKYGSQDRFTLFSFLVSPFVDVFGVRIAFFLLYLVSQTAFQWAACRLLKALFADKRIAMAGAMFVAVAPMWYGGLSVFHVNEPFFTPRLAACALTLICLEQMLRNQWLRSMAFLLAAMLIHPLMAAGGILVGAWYYFSGKRPLWWMLGAAAALVCVAASLNLSGVNIAGHSVPVLDDTWRDIIRRAAAYNFPDEWTSRDWGRVMTTLLLVAGAAATMVDESPQSAALLFSTGIAAGAGLLLTAVASSSKSAILFQAQPYRALWLAAFFHGPCSLWLIWWWWHRRSGAGRILGLAAAYLLMLENQPVPLSGMVPVLVVVIGASDWLLHPNKPAGEVLIQAILISLAVALLVSGIVIPAIFVAAGPSKFGLRDAGPLTYVRVITQLSGPVLWYLAGLAVVVTLSKRRSFRGSWAVAAALVLAIQCLFYLAPAFAHEKDRTNDIAFLHHYLETHSANRTQTVYTDWANAQDLWMDVTANSYFHLSQTIGVIFNRDTAIEAMRRAAIVGPFERRRSQRPGVLLGGIVRISIDRIFGQRSSQVVKADLLHLCEDSQVDIASIDAPAFEGFDADNGSTYIYDCHRMRQKQDQLDVVDAHR